MVELRTTSPATTQCVGEVLASYLPVGAIVGFTGELGAGKTCFIKGVCRGLGVDEDVTSPTFVLMHAYRGRSPVYHFDLYRLDDPLQLYDLDYEMFFWSDGIALVEWVERAGGLVEPGDYIEVEILFDGSQDGRIIRVRRLEREEDFEKEAGMKCIS
jgi:tRNA threonylcarbamoyladenosine biosynthesis protein TsaE